MITALDSQDFLTLTLALDMLARQVESELSKLRQQDSNTVKKRLAMLNMRQQVQKVRAKLQAMERELSSGNALLQPECSNDEARHPIRMKEGIAAEMARMHQTKALLIAAQYAADYECEFVVSDALAAILVQFEQHIATLDQLCTKAEP